MTENEYVQEPEHHYPDRPWPAVWSLVVGFFMILLDGTVVTVAMPAIMAGLDTDINGAVWATSAYLLAYAVPLLIFGALGDRIGPKRMYLTGLVIFTLSSVLCGLSGSIAALIAWRAVQGVGGAMLSPQTMAITTRLFPPQRRGAAMGLWGAVAGIAALLGPLMGGLLVDGPGWEWIFFINFPIGIIAFFLSWRNVPDVETRKHRFDFVGVVLSAIGMFCLIFGLQEAESYDWGQIWGPVSVWSLIITGIVVMLGFVVWQAVQKGEPLVPLALFKDRNFAVANVTICAMGYLVTSMVIPIMLYTQTVRGLTPTRAALLTIPSAVVAAVLSLIIGKLLNSRNPRWYVVAGMSCLALSLALYIVLMKPDYSVLWLLVPSFTQGLGNSMIWGPLSISATRNLPVHRAGSGSGVYNTTRQMGSVLGSAMIAMVMANRIAAHLPTGAGPQMSRSGTQLPAFLQERFATALAQSLYLPLAAAVIGAIAALFLVPVHKRPVD
ncbi:MAG: DHA2 family efflux MFS transporter permease subunit [Propionibacteriaceae bacterium]